MENAIWMRLETSRKTDNSTIDDKRIGVYVSMHVFTHTHLTPINILSNWTFTATGVCVIRIKYQTLDT